MVTSRSVPQQIEQMLSARAGHCRAALRLLQIGHIKVFSSNSENEIMPHFRRGLQGCQASGTRFQVRREITIAIVGHGAILPFRD
jgi:hypothetical protein